MLKSGLVAFAFSILAVPAVMADQPSTEAVVADPNLVTAKVNGMVCDFCAQAVMSMFGKDAAVETVEVDLDRGEIRISTRDGHDLSDERVEDLVTKSGYDLVEIVRPAT